MPAPPTKGARVWVRVDGKTRCGAITSEPGESHFLNCQGVVIVLDGGTTIIATTDATRGTQWDLERRRTPRPS